MKDGTECSAATADDAVAAETRGLPMSRRTMLKTSGAAAGALALAGCTGGSDGNPTPVPATPTGIPDPTATPEPSATAEPTVAPTPTPEPPRPMPGPLPVDAATAVETWDEPWTWRPSEFPADALQLNVIEHESPSTLVGFGNPGASLFGYNGTIPGPTIRMRGDETYDLRLLNHLGLNVGDAPIGPAPDPAAYPPDLTNKTAIEDGIERLPDWCLGEHSNGVHTIHTTNMHTHGLHVRPGMNPTGPSGAATVSDDIFTRLEPADDLRMREENPDVCGDGPLEGEVGASASYQFILGDVQGDPDQPHPPGTHWYHPHAHGSTHNQVSSGLAGFLIIEGNVDAAINGALTDRVDPDPAIPTGPYGYRERVMLIQRVNPGNVSVDQDAQSKRLQQQTVVATNGLPQAANIVMRPGAIERWRVLNGSVDGKGYLRFMVLRGQWVHEQPPGAQKKPTTLEGFLGSAAQLLRVEDDGRRMVPTTEEIENAKVPLQQLAVDGVTLVDGLDSSPTYHLRDLNFSAPPNPLKQDFSNLGACYDDAESLRACYDRPNEMYMAPANRTDMMFQAPRLADGLTPEVHTVLGKATAIHTENLQRAIQLLEADLAYANEQAEASGKSVAEIVEAMKLKLPLPTDTIVGYVVVKNATGTGADAVGDVPPYDLNDLNQALRVDAPLPAYLQPLVDEDLRMTAGEIADRGLSGTNFFRTRRVAYSGWGAATWPILAPEDIAVFDPALGPVGEINEVYIAERDTQPPLVLPPLYRTMAIDGRKFNPDDPGTPRMGLDTSEEWAAFNNSISLWGELSSDVEVDFDGDDVQTQLGLRTYSIDHTTGFVVTRREARERGWGITTRGIDHPFHIHINPMWVLSIDVPDQDGNLVNVLSSPRWHDVVWLPRNGGRIVFRSRFPDFTGRYVNHCHILLHEDNGMMQMVEVVSNVAEANYVAATEVAAIGNGLVYPPDPGEVAYQQCTRFIDNNTNPGRAQEYPAVNGVFNPPVPT